MACWGCNDHGQLGDGTREDRATPVPVTGLGRIEQLALGPDLSCATDDGGRVWCWGTSAHGQCGRWGEDAVEPVMIEGIDDVVRVTAGGTGVCALEREGALWCWGEDRYRHFAGVMASRGDRPIRIDSALSGHWVDVRADPAGNTCVLDQEGTVTCWGSDLGDWGEAPGSAASNEERQRWFAGLGGPTVVTRGATGFLRHARPVCVWKAGDGGRTWACLDDDRGPGQTAAGVPTGVRSTWPQLALSERHGCAMEGGRVTCWGEDDDGQVAGAAVAALDDVVQVVTGPYRSCALRQGGAVTCWGEPRGFATGDATMAVPSPSPPPPDGTGPRRLADLRGVVAVAAENTEQPCAIVRGGMVRCLHGTRWRAVPGLADVVELSAGDTHACARTRSGSVRCWGTWYFGPYNHDGDSSDWRRASKPRRIGRFRARAIASRGESDCALLIDGSVQCWGRRAQRSLTPVTVVKRTAWVDLAMSERWECGVDPEGTARCWASFEDAGEPAPITLTDVVTLAVAGARGCAVRSGGAVQCWGEGPAGDGTWMERARPAAVEGIGPVEGLSVGITHACARTREAGVRCWGDNDQGQLGDGTTRPGLVPTAVALPGVPAEVAGVAAVSWRPNRTTLTSHTGTLVWTESGEVWIWGEAPAQ